MCMGSSDSSVSIAVLDELYDFISTLRCFGFDLKIPNGVDFTIKCCYMYIIIYYPKLFNFIR